MFKKIKKIGFLKTYKIIKNRTQKNIYTFLLKKRFFQKILASPPIYNCNTNFIDQIIAQKSFNQFLPNKLKDKDYIIKTANKYNNNCFNILNSGEICFKQNKIDWQYGAKKDIKIPWELSRFHHAIILGKAYQITKDEKYTKTFITHINSWTENNKIMTGANWICPMDVSIRAINFLWAYNYFKNSSLITTDFLDKFIKNLYLHKFYLKNNFEIFIKNNNHYLSDLIGYLYLLVFFKEDKNIKKLIKLILKEFETQILPDGTCYEGSSNYHKLVTEIFLHFYFICKVKDINLDKKFKIKLNKMLLFLNQASYKNRLTQTGDNDSGKIVFGLKLGPVLKKMITPRYNFFAEAQKSLGASASQLKIFHKKYFGLTIIKNKNIHITYRHPTYQENQPTGHFHQDRFAITLSIMGQQILVDPGTYVYTANPKYRNLLRSFKSHNTFYLKKEMKDAHPKNFDLFLLPQKNQKNSAVIKKIKNKILIKNSFENNFATYKRILILDQDKRIIKIKDYLEEKNKENNGLIFWNFIFHPKIKLEKDNDKSFLIKYNNKKLATFNSTLNFKQFNSIYSPTYGKLIKTKKLKSSTPTKNFICRKNLITIQY